MMIFCEFRFTVTNKLLFLLLILTAGINFCVNHGLSIILLPLLIYKTNVNKNKLQYLIKKMFYTVVFPLYL